MTSTSVSSSTWSPWIASTLGGRNVHSLDVKTAGKMPAISTLCPRVCSDGMQAFNFRGSHISQINSFQHNYSFDSLTSPRHPANLMANTYVALCHRDRTGLADR